MSFKTILITGANRGLGLEFVKQFLSLPSPPSHIFATCRNPDQAKDLLEIQKANSNVEVLKLDIKNHQSFPEFVKQLKSKDGFAQFGLNLLINNAGIALRDSLEEVCYETMMENFEVNAVCPLLFTKALLPLLKQASHRVNGKSMSCSRAAVVNITSKMGSIDDNTSGSYYPYRTSKVAMNMIGKSLSVDLAEDRILCILLHPGWVQTEMGGENALITTQVSVEGMIDTILKANEEYSGRFFAYDGKEIPW